MRNLLKRFIGFLCLLLLFWLGQKLLLPAFKQALSSRHWEAKDGMVISNQITSKSSKKGNLYQLKFVYQYTIQSQIYQGNSRYFAFEEPQQSRRRSLSKFVQKHPASTSILVYYNPEAPAQSTIIRGVLWQHWLLLAINSFFLLMVLHLIAYPEKWILKTFSN